MLRRSMSDKSSLGLLILCWIAASFWWPLADPIAPRYVYAYLWAGPLMLVPLAYGEQWPWPYGLIAALSLLLSYSLPVGVGAAIGLVPWVGLLLVWSIHRRRENADRHILARLAPFWLLVAAGWTMADRFGWEPLGFSPIIVLLTAVHFHYAGFALSWLGARVELSRGWSVVLMVGIAGVAIGITASQFGAATWVEGIPALLLVVGGWRLAWRQWQWSADVYATPLQRWGRRISSLSLVVGLGLAVLYGWRGLWWPGWLSIPWMYAVHGTLNALGFAIPGLLSWSAVTYRRPSLLF